MTRNIFEGARGDLLKLSKVITEDKHFAPAIGKKAINTKLGLWMSKIYVNNRKDLKQPQWLALTILLNSMVEFILTNMIKEGRFKFPPVWQWLKLVSFIKIWMETLFDIFKNEEPVIPAKLLPARPSKKRMKQIEKRNQLHRR